MIYVLAYPEFEPFCATRIDDFRAAHEPHRAKLVPPHITLVFGAQSAHAQVITDLALAVADQTQEFPVIFDEHAIEFDPFEQKHKIFLLCGDGAHQVTAMHKQLYEGDHRADLSAAHPFRPHMTIATYAERAQIECVDVADAGDLPLRGTLRALDIVRFSNGTLTSLKKIPFRR
ncbi:2'-5' RNA ligase family protein [Primorskyibacter sp. S187A]|uniref:2'-5' RNA ligase family protein n=1 Tax=Primorskyibacter sp. S187A TaxID=3415130 RepID=UPI003C7B7BA6